MIYILIDIRALNVRTFLYTSSSIRECRQAGRQAGRYLKVYMYMNFMRACGLLCDKTSLTMYKTYKQTYVYYLQGCVIYVCCIRK